MSRLGAVPRRPVGAAPVEAPELPYGTGLGNKRGERTPRQHDVGDSGVVGEGRLRFAEALVVGGNPLVPLRAVGGVPDGDLGVRRDVHEKAVVGLVY